MSSPPAHSPPAAAGPSRTTMYVLLSLPFFANDIWNICVTDYEAWLVLDFVSVKLVPLALLAYFLGKKWLAPADIGLARPRWGKALAWTALLSLAGLGLDQYGWGLAKDLLPDTSLGAIPLDRGSPLYVFDLTLGLGLVGVVEEAVFRGVALAAFRERGYGPAGIVLASSIVFGLIHWSVGLHAIVTASAIGAVFMAGTMASGSVLPAMAAHFLVNFASFSGWLASTVN